MIKQYYLLASFICLFSSLVLSQNPATITFPTPTPNPANLGVDSYTRAVTQINLQPGFKYGFVSGGATHLLNLSLGTNPTFVSSGYLGSGINPNNITCGAVNYSQNSLVGETSGDFSVSQMGGAVYQIDIYTPPGSNNLEPNISIFYNSQKGLGLLGKSWDLSGLMNVSRDSKTVIQDGKFDGIKLDNSDVFQLNGNHLFGLTGTYGADGATYYPEIENFSTIISHGTQGNGPQWFEVKDKKGYSYEYGKTADSRLTGKNDPTVLKWNLNRKIDEFGNYIDYKYNNLNGEVIIDEILYTGNLNSNLPTYNSIKFKYIETVDKNTKYINGKEFNYSKILKSISVYAEGNLVKKYALDYLWDKQSELAKITESDKDGKELVPTTFCWEAAGPNYNDNAMFVPSGIVPALCTVGCDLDGDGSTDRVYVPDGMVTGYQALLYKGGLTVNHTESSLQKASFYINSAIADDNYDNKQELYLVNSITASGNSYNIDKITYPSYNNINVTRTTYNTASSHVFDDITKPHAVFFNVKDYTADGTFDNLVIDPETIRLTAANCTINYNFNSFGQLARPIQFDEDAETEFIVYNTTNPNVMLINILDLNISSSSISFLYSLSIPVSGLSSGSLLNYFNTGDFNKDGKGDLCYISSDALSTDINVRYSTGTQFTSATHVDTWTGVTLPIIGGPQIDCVDLNYDGFDDITIHTPNLQGHPYYIPPFNSSDYYTVFSLGNSFQKGGFYRDLVSQNLDSFEGSLGSSGNIDFSYHIYLDHNFDSIKENIIVKINDRRLPSIAQITSGLGKTIKIHYAIVGEAYSNASGAEIEALTHFQQNYIANDFQFYFNTGTTNYAGTDLFVYKPLIHNVSKVVISDIQSTIKKNYFYTYEDGILHTKGRGFLGYEKVNKFEICEEPNLTSTSPPSEYYNSQHSISSFNNNYKIPLQTTFITGKHQGSDFRSDLNYALTTILFSKRTNQISFVPRYTKGFFISTDQTDAKDYLNSNEIATQYSYDLNSNGQPVTINSAYGWEGTTVVNRLQTSTYQLNNGYYKPDLVTIAQTQAGQSAYSRSVKYNFNSNGTILNVITDPTFGGDAVTTTFSNYTPHGQAQTKIISAGNLPLSRIMTTNYDVKGRFVVQKTNALNYTENYTYEPAFGNIISHTDISGLQTTASYDGLGRLIQSNLPNGVINKTTYSYENIAGFPYPSSSSNIGVYSIKAESQGMPYSKTYYDANGRALRGETQGFNGNVTLQDVKYNYLYNAASGFLPSGLLLEATEPYYAGQSTFLKQQFEYETLAYRTSKQKTVVQNPTAPVTNIFNQYTYTNPSTNGNYIKSKITVVNQNAQQLKKEFNAAGQNDLVTNVQGPVNQTATYIFNSNGSPKQINLSNAPGAPILFNYNNLGQQTQLIDPSAGTTNYNYDPIGELTKRTIVNGTNNYELDYTYDVLGRLSNKTANQTGMTSYQYVTGNNGKGNLEKITGPTGTDQVINEYTYDFLGRTTQEKETIGAKTFINNYAYDQIGNLIQYQFPNGYTVKQQFDALSYLTQIKDVNDNLIWSLSGVNASGQALQYTYGNGLSTNNTYTDLHDLKTKVHGSLFNQTYNFNPANENLTKREFASSIVTQKENFMFDGADRLTQSQQVDYYSNAVIQTNNINYNGLGDITHKDDAGDYSYTNPGNPFTLTNINNPSPNISSYMLTVDYNDLKKVKHILEGTSNKEFDIAYGNDEDRCKMTYKVAGVNQYDRYYLSNYDRQETGAAYKEWNYVYAPTGLCAVNYNNNGTQQLLYTSTDHLGSPLFLTDASQNIIEQYSFDAWGRRRDANDWNNYNVTTPQYLIRGFTMHEHLDEVGLINMNARLYDPVIGRFLQADNDIQDPDNLQNINRYTYALNNPLKYTDPSGNQYDGDDENEDDYGQGNGWAEMLDNTYHEFGTGEYMMFGGDLNGVDVYSGPNPDQLDAIANAWDDNEDNDNLMDANDEDIQAGSDLAQSDYEMDETNEYDSGEERIYGGDGSGSALDYTYRTADFLNQFNPIANLWDLVTNAMYGTDRFGNKMTQTDAWMKTAGMIPIGRGGGLLFRTNSIPHIFRNSVGHVNPSTLTSQGRYMQLFRNVAANSANQAPTLNPAAVQAGVQTFQQTFRNGKQVWVQTINNEIFDAGVNLKPR